MKFNIFFTLQGPASTLEVPNKHNPVVANNLEEILQRLVGRLPNSFSLGLKCVGLRIKEAK